MCLVTCAVNVHAAPIAPIGSKGEIMNARGLRLLIVALLAAMLLGAGGMARASAHDHGRDDGVPRGTFKVDDSDFEDLPANTPHVVCGFRVAMLRHPRHLASCYDIRDPSPSLSAHMYRPVTDL